MMRVVRKQFLRLGRRVGDARRGMCRWEELRNWSHGDISEFEERFRGMGVKLRGPVGQGEMPPTVDWAGQTYKVVYEDPRNPKTSLQDVADKLLNDLSDVNVAVKVRGEESIRPGITVYEIVRGELGQEYGSVFVPFDAKDLEKLRAKVRKVSTLKELKLERWKARERAMASHLMHIINTSEEKHYGRRNAFLTACHVKVKCQLTVVNGHDNYLFALKLVPGPWGEEQAWLAVKAVMRLIEHWTPLLLETSESKYTGRNPFLAYEPGQSRRNTHLRFVVFSVSKATIWDSKRGWIRNAWQEELDRRAREEAEGQSKNPDADESQGWEDDG